jgi:hypothetical protein
MSGTWPLCTTCGARQLKPDARFCHHCGAELPLAPVAAPVATGPVAKPRGLRWFWLALVSLVVLALAFGALAVLFQRNIVPDDPDALVAWYHSRVENLVLSARQATERLPDSIAPGPDLSPTTELALALPAETPQATPTMPSAPAPTATAAATTTPVPSPTAAPTDTSLPTHTPLPTDTPAPTATPPPSPTPGCARQVGDPFRDYWQAHRAALGCPLNGAAWTDAATEAFERGRMIWRANNDLIYVMNNAGNWGVFKDSYVEGAPEPGGYAAPAVRQAPVRGFGAIWRERLGGPNARVGWATEPERAAKIQTQDFERGAIIRLDGTNLILTENGAHWFAQ